MSVKLIETNVENKLEVFAMMNSNKSLPMKGVPNGTEMEINKYVIFEITNEKTGEIFESIALKDVSGLIYATRSQSVIKYIRDLKINFGDEIMNNGLYFVKDTGTSNNGRDFVTISLLV